MRVWGGKEGGEEIRGGVSGTPTLKGDPLWEPWGVLGEERGGENGDPLPPKGNPVREPLGVLEGRGGGEREWGPPSPIGWD